MRIGTKLENQSVAQIVISTAADESQTLAFNYASLALNNSFFLHHLVRSPIPPIPSDNSQPLQKPPRAPAQNHESALNERPVNSDRTQVLGSIIGAQLGSLADLKTYVAAAAQGIQSGGGAGGFIWLVTDALGRLGVVATYGAGTLLVADRRQSLAPDGIELGGIYEPSTLPPSSPSSPSPSAARASAPAQTRALSTSAHASAQRPANVWSGRTLPSSNLGAASGSSEAPTELDALGQTLYPLFCVSVHEHAWMAAGYGVWGMETYLERFWTCLDWAAVRNAYAQYASRKSP